MYVGSLSLLVLALLRARPSNSALNAVRRCSIRPVAPHHRFSMQKDAPDSEAVKVVPARKDGSHIVACYTDDYDRLLAEKVVKLREMLNWKDAIDVHESPRCHFRMRANFGMWHDDPKNRVPEGFYYSMYDDVDKFTPCEVKQFPRGSQQINKLMTQLLATFREYPDIFTALFEVRFLTTQTEEAVITLCYKRPLSEGWQAAAEEVCAKLGVKIVGRARKMKQVAGGEETVVEKLTVKGAEYRYYQTEGAFSQPNAAVCEKMINWAADRTQGSEGEDLLELYCGGGTFTAALACNFRKVLATEISKASVELANKTFKLNGIGNIKIARLSSEEFSDAHSGKKQFNRLQEGGIAIKDYQISTVLVDPPRAGLDADTCRLLSQFEKIVYISCNPETLARDVLVLQQTHAVLRVAAFDQFPYTHHLESGVFMVKKQQGAEAGAEAEVGAEAGAGAEEGTETNPDEGAPEKRQRTA
ncbi:uracil-5--methyltransferase-domain-containing protein [Ochromonadaceae sp. CCMP2298]|nr:uracil-5--methyltransferase-domain-containing protein [Ochromonadaceae sp. CCMP2298]